MNVGDLLSADAEPARVERVAITALADGGIHDLCPSYLAALRRALADEPPPFGTRAYSELYRDAASDARWLAISLMTNAEREGDGAKRLWSLAACSTDTDHRRQLKEHAVDESRHALFYLALLDFAFPGLTEPSFRLALRQLSPRYALDTELVPVSGSPYAKPPTIDDFIQMNIAEIRTAIHHLMQRPALAAHAPAENFAGMQPILDALLRDELRHVAYTAALIERLAHSPVRPDVTAMVRKRLRDFNAITTEELGQVAFDCSVSCCEKRPHCRAKAGVATAFLDAPF
ncbi:hypothetical protein [Bradyrhizobium sp. 2TAF24]|uniref:hypothetical protein n=1 Tax=Bradyrhizobium sp. 2TAF24 TaxID=3233011 RepID=UPI003F917FE3